MIVITGASEGLGRELALLYLSADKHVVSLSRTPPPDGVEHIATDLSDPQSIENAVESLLSIDEPIEVLVHNAAMQTVDSVRQQKPQNITRTLQVNVGAVMHLTSRLLERIVADKGDILVVTSNKAVAPFTMDPLYGASQFAERGYAISLQEELKETSTRVLIFAPCGFTSRIVEKATGVAIEDAEEWADPKDLALIMKQNLDLPKRIQVTEITLDRKAWK